MTKKILFVVIVFTLVFSFNIGSAAYAKDKSCPYEGTYFCPKEGCTYKSDKPGKCPNCGEELKKHECTVAYVCPMKECNYKTDQPGKCPKCGMELEKKTMCTCKDTDKAKCKHEDKDEDEKEHEHK